jgi:predicted nuclease of predicted toxin-antitoxin system
LKLLLDENISHRIVAGLLPYYNGSSHVRDEGLASASDAAVWEYAKANGFTIVTKDDDFSAMSALRGHPPRLIKLSLGNCTNAEVLAALIAHAEHIAAQFASDEVASVELAAQRR